MKKHLKKVYLTLILALTPAVEFVASAQDAEIFLNNATSTVKTAAKAAVDLVSAIIGLVGILMLAWNFYKRAKGDQQSNDALMGWGAALIVAVIFLQIIKATLLQ